MVRDVTDRKRLEEQLHASQKMESLGRMAGGVAHDFNNYLTVIQGFSGLAQSMATDGPPNLRSALERIESASAKAARLTNQLLLFSRKQAVTPQYLDVNKTIAALKTILLPLLGDTVEFEIMLDPAAGHVYMDSGQFEQVLVNLAVNARDAMATRGCLTISTQHAVVTGDELNYWMHMQPNQYTVICVQDTGPGMEETVKKQIFEPFFTTKAKGKGTGLGLSICHSIVEQNGGHIHVESKVGEGTTFYIYLPQTTPPNLCPDQLEVATARNGVGTILLVEDDDPVREVVDEVLSTHGYTVLSCSSGPAALALAGESTAKIDLLITDLAMPHMGGHEVAEKFLQLRPDVPVLFVSGYTDGLPEELVNRPNIRFLPKPYTATTLTESVRRSLSAIVPTV